jgi:kynurenine formamidase
VKIDLEELAEPIDISIPLRFNGPQPNAYGVDAAVSKPVEAGELVGDTRLGGSVNFEQYTFIPHCNGTHTECVGHITDERISVRDCLQDVLIPAVLVSVEPQNVDGERLIRAELLRMAFTPEKPAYADKSGRSPALIVRTLPNDESKLTRSYGEENVPPYFTAEAMEYVIECGFKHLLVDLPSIDRIFDDGKLANHRIFWNVEPGSGETHAATRIYSTITELIYVPNEVADGDYMLNLQIAPFESDAAPSRPVLFRVT